MSRGSLIDKTKLRKGLKLLLPHRGCALGSLHHVCCPEVSALWVSFSLALGEHSGGASRKLASQAGKQTRQPSTGGGLL